MATVDKSAKYSPPREYHRYDKTPHVRHRLACDRRPITNDRARSAVACGQVEENPVAPDANEWRFRHRVEGCEVVVVCGGEQPEEGRHGHRIVTAFVDVVNATEAFVGTEWKTEEVHIAAFLQCLNAGFNDAVDGFHGRRVDVYDPIEYGGHLLVWNEGHTEPFCLKCRHTTVDGDEWKGRPCLP